MSVDLYELSRVNVVPVVSGEAGSLSLEEFVQAVSWEDHIDQAAMRVVVSLTWVKELGRYVREGSTVYLLAGDKEIMRGRVFERRVATEEEGSCDLEVYDPGIYLVKSEEDMVFRDVTATQVIREICREFSVPMGKLAETGTVIKRLVFRGKSLWDIMVGALVESRKLSGKRYVLRFEQGKLCLYEKTSSWGPAQVYVLEEGVNLLSALRVDSLHDLRTQVKIVGPAASDTSKAPVRAVVSDKKLIEQYGLLQHLEVESGGSRLDEARARANELLKKLGKIRQWAQVAAVGYYNLRAGDSVFVYESITELAGRYWVKSIKNQAAGGVVTSDLLLEFEDIGVGEEAAA